MELELDDLDIFVRKNLLKLPKKEFLDEDEDEKLLNYNGDSIPLFVELVFDNKHLNKKAKNQFKTKFWKFFSNPKNYEYRKKTLGKYLFWFNQKFMGVYDTIDDIIDEGKIEDDRYFIQITNKSESAFFKYEIPEKYIKTEHGTFLDTFKTEAFCLNKKVPLLNDITLGDNVIIDTGCTISDFLDTSYFDLKTFRFTEYPPGYKLNFFYKKTKMLEWNENKISCKEVQIKTANGNILMNKIFLKDPFYIKINNLNPVPMYSFTVPNENSDVKTNKLLGLDFISKINMSIVNENGLVKMILSDIE